MSEKTPQSFANHARLVPLYHFVALPILLINLTWSAYRAVTAFSTETAIDALVAIALVIVGLFARVFALWAQDRVIRLEERLRMEQLLPDDLKGRIGDFETDQLVALRFASDDELAELARKVLEDDIADRKSIKQLITVWRADYQRV